MIIRARFSNALAILMVVLCAASLAWGFQDKDKAGAKSKDQHDPAELLTEFIFYAKVAQIELAVANGQALLDAGLSNAELAVLLDEKSKESPKRFDEAVARAQRVPELESIASELARRVEEGRRDLGRDPKRIDEAINMLVGTQRARLLGRARLLAAGEHAVPGLLKQITEGRNEQLKLACQDMLEQIGREAVQPLCEALLNLTGQSQRTVCDILGTIRHPNAAPYLRELALDEKADGPSREAAARAFRSVGGEESMNLSMQYADLARQYFDENESLIAYPLEASNNIWSYDQFTGLRPTPVPTAIFSEVMATRVSNHAIKIDPTNTTALSLFVAANLKRENDLPEGASDPIYGDSKYTPEFYATVFGTQTCLDVLGLALDKVDTQLVRDAIAALSRTTGGGNLFARGKGRSPLLEALSYPDRRVQYEAALTLGRALPQEKFTGDASVVPILSSAVRMGNKSLVLLVADDLENRRQAGSQLESMAFDVVGSGGNVMEVQPDIVRAVGVDLIVVRMRGAEDAKHVVKALRAIPKTSAAPVLIIASATDMGGLKADYRGDHRVNVGRAGVTPAQFTEAVDVVMKSGAGGRITEAEAEEYAIRSLGVLRDVAISRSPAYTIVDAVPALIDALDTRTGGTRMLVADILALIDNDNAQRKLFDVALAATGDEQVELLQRVADSVRIWGDHAEPRHIKALVALVANSSGATAEAAATVHGALNLPPGDAIKLIP